MQVGTVFKYYFRRVSSTRGKPAKIVLDVEILITKMKTFYRLLLLLVQLSCFLLMNLYISSRNFESTIYYRAGPKCEFFMLP
jgi:hypothetical protein